MVQNFSNVLANIMSSAMFFLLLHPALEWCSCLFCTFRLLGAARKKPQSCRLVPLHIHGLQPQLGLNCYPTFSLLLVTSSCSYIGYGIYLFLAMPTACESSRAGDQQPTPQQWHWILNLLCHQGTPRWASLELLHTLPQIPTLPLSPHAHLLLSLPLLWGK